MSSPIDAVVRRLRAKLGRCPRCMRLSVMLALCAWTAFAALLALWPRPVALLAAAVLASGLTLLALGHLLTFGWRLAAALRTLPPPDGAVPADRSRRELLTLWWKAALAALLGPALLRSSAWAQVTQPTCPGTHAVAPPHPIVLNTCVNKNNKNKPKVAQNQTQGTAKQNAMAFAETSCNARTCPQAQTCVRDGEGYTLVFVNCVANAAIDCGDKNLEGFTCTWQVTAIKCKCRRS